MLDSFFSLQLRIDFGGSSSCTPGQYATPTNREREKDGHSPAAAAGSCGLADLGASAPGLRASRPNGLRCLVASDWREAGDRERRSNLDWRRWSGSVWSKRDRFARRSSSAMLKSGSGRKRDSEVKVKHRHGGREREQKKPCVSFSLEMDGLHQCGIAASTPQRTFQTCSQRVVAEVCSWRTVVSC